MKNRSFDNSSVNILVFEKGFKVEFFFFLLRLGDLGLVCSLLIFFLLILKVVVVLGKMFRVWNKVD